MLEVFISIVQVTLRGDLSRFVVICKNDTVMSSKHWFGTMIDRMWMGDSREGAEVDAKFIAGQSYKGRDGDRREGMSLAWELSP